MQPRLLIINCPSEYFFYIPMGTFGICDYLSRQNIPVKLLNLAIYKEPETYKVLEHYLESFRPTHVGIIFHWQETTEGFLQVGKLIKSFNKDVSIISGGFTAGYFSKDLLEKYGFLDFVIKGDPEKPLELLLNGAKTAEVPNLGYRSHSGIKSNKVSWFVDQDTLSGISFSDPTYLYDYNLYLEAIDKKLGFPVFIGRGCIHSCRYCGGSRSAFKAHSASGIPVNRCVEAVVKDLRKLKNFTRTIYMCYENDRDYIKALFGKMKEESFVKTFRLNYGAWRLLDKEFLELYKELFILSGDTKPAFELSPEIFDDECRRKVKNGSVYFSIAELKENISLINNHLGNNVNVSVFFSRYHDAIKTYSGMKKEIAGISRLKHDLFCDNITNANISYDHLSTDVASRYWEEHVKQPKSFDVLTTAVWKLKARGNESFPVDNLCMYIPEDLSESEVFRCELLISILKYLEKHSRELYHIMFKCLDESMIEIFEDIISESYSGRSDNVFAAFDYRELLNILKQKIAGDRLLFEKLPFADDLINLNLRKLEVKQQPLDPEVHYPAKPLKLDHNLISIHEHDYLDLQRFLKRLGEGIRNLRLDRTVYVFLADEILSMPCETYDFTLKEFEKGVTAAQYCKTMENRRIFTLSYHDNLIRKLFQSKVLF